MVAVVFASQLAIDPELGLLTTVNIAPSAMSLVAVFAVPVDVVHVSPIARGRRQVTVNCFELLFELFSSHFRSCFSCETFSLFIRQGGVVPLFDVDVLHRFEFDPEVPVRALHQVRAASRAEVDVRDAEQVSVAIAFAHVEHVIVVFFERIVDGQ